MRFRLVEEQGATQTNKNSKSKRDFLRYANNKNAAIELPPGTVVHHLDDNRRDNDGTKSNAWDNILIIPSIASNSSYAEMIHRIITSYQRVTGETSIYKFFKEILELKVYQYDENNDEILSSTVAEILGGR